MAISTNGTVLARVAGALYNTQMSNATYKEVASLDPAALANTLYARDFSASTDAAVATILVTNLGLSAVTGLDNWVAAQLTAAGSAKGAKVVDLLNSFAQMSADATYGAAATAWNTKVDAALALSQTTDNKGGTFAAAGVDSGATFALTAGVDTFTGATANDTINAAVATLGALDVINGGAGADTLNVVDAGAVASFGGATISNVETVKVSSGGAVGAIAVAATAAGTTTTAVAQKATITLTGTYATGDTLLVTVGGKVWTATVGSTASTTTFGHAEAATAVAAVLSATIGDAVTIASTSTGSATAAATHITTIGLTAKVAGTPIPVSIAKGVVAGTATVGMGTTALASASTTSGVVLLESNTTGTGTTAVAEQKQIALSGSTAFVPSVNVTINGITYTAATSTGSIANATTLNGSLAADIARVINSVLGAGSATSAAGTNTGNVVITSLTPGAPLPLINVSMNADGSNTLVAATEAHSVLVPNQTLNSAAVAAVAASALAAPTGTTEYNVAAVGVANVSAPTTTAVSASGTTVLSSGGAAVTVTASDSVSVTGAKGAVTITGSAKPATAITINPGVSTANASTAAGVAVTGGTTVTVTGKGGTASSGAITSSATNNTATNIGTDPTAVTSANSDGTIAVTGSTVGATTIAGLANAPTGDVSIANKTAFTDAKGFADAIYGTGAATIFTNGATTVSVSGAGTTNIKDLKTIATTTSSAIPATVGTSTLSTIKLAGVGTTTVTSDVISNVTIVDTALGGATTVTLQGSSATASNAAALNLTLGNNGKSGANLTVAQANATAVTIATQNSATAAVNGTTNNSDNGTFLTLNTPKATSITMTNTGAVDLGDLSASGTAKVASVNASGATGSVVATIDSTPLQGMAFTGGAGNDVLTFKASANFAPNSTSAATTTINLGAGNDQLLNATTTVHTITGLSINGGEGVDTVSASLLNAGNAAQFVNFEQVGLDLQTNNATFDVSLLAGATGLYMTNNPDGSDAVTYSGLTTAQGLTIGASQTSTASVILDFSTAVKTTSVTDAYTITFAGKQSLADIAGTSAGAISATGIHSGIVDVSGIETVNVVSGGTGLVANTLVVKDVVSTTGGARGLTITGDKAVTVSFNTAFGIAGTSTTADGVSSIDASALTGNLTINTANAATAYAGLSIKGGSGNDEITMSNQSTGTGRVTVDAGAGDDTIIAKTVSSTLTGGSGKDNFNVATAVVASTSANVITTITDLQAGDKITLATDTNTFTSTKIDVSTATTLTAALNLAAADTGGNLVTWFQYAGNTYLVEDIATGTSLAATDLVVKIAGLVDLSTSVYASNVLTIA